MKKRSLLVLLFVMMIGVSTRTANAFDDSDFDVMVSHVSYLEEFIPITDDYEVLELSGVGDETTAFAIWFYEQNEVVSYVVLANQEGLPCIEFGEGESGAVLTVKQLLNYAESMVNCEQYKICYFGGIDYYLNADEVMYMINESGISTCDEMEVDMTNSSGYYTTTLSWADVLALEDTGYVGGTRYYAPGGSTFYSEYFDMSTVRDMAETSLEGICAATAAYNFCAYWYNRGFNAFLLSSSPYEFTNNANRATLCKKIISLFGESTADSNCMQYLKSILGQYGYGYMSAHYEYDVSWSGIVSAIGQGAVLLHLHGHDVYQDHSVLGVGYVSFAFSSGWTSRYCIVVDGWNGSATSEGGFRYVNYSLGIDQINMTAVVPDT